MPRVRAKGSVMTRVYCAIDDRSAGRKVIELDLMTEKTSIPRCRRMRSHRHRPADHQLPDHDRTDRAEGDFNPTGCSANDNWTGFRRPGMAPAPF